MKLMSSLALRHLKVNRNRTFFTIFAVLLSVAMFTGVVGITASTYNAFYQLAKATGRDIESLLDQFSTVLYTVSAFLAAIIMIGSVIVIANAFSISAGERIRQFGILKSVGATREQIRRSVLSEGIFLCAAGIPLGLIVGVGVTAIGAALANKFLGSSDIIHIDNVPGAALEFRLVFNLPALLISVALSFATVMLSAWLTAHKASRLSAIEAIRLTGETKIKTKARGHRAPLAFGQILPLAECPKTKKLRTSRLIQRLFGFEGTLAAKSLKRSSRKYRATVVSLVTSMVLVIIGSGFGNLLYRSTEILEPDLDANVLISNNAGMTVDKADELTERFSEYPDTKVQRVMPAMWTLTKHPDNYNPPSLKGKPPMLYLICLDEKAYTDYCRQIGAKAGSVILLKDIPVSFDDSQEFRFADPEGNPHSLKVTVQSSKFTPMLRQMFISSATDIVISPEMAKALGVKVGAIWLMKTGDVSGFSKYAEGMLTADFGIRDLTKEAAGIKQIYMLVMIFIYGFIAMLTLIGVTSVIATVYSGIQLRAPEFAVLSAVGMTAGGRRRMLNLESLLYGLKSLIIGLPLGVALTYAMFRMFSLQINFTFEVPWMAVGLCVLGTFAVTFVSMLYASSQIRRSNIAETMRSVNL